MPKKKTSKIKYEAFSTRGSWAYYDCLGKKQIKDGDQIILLWPNFQTQRVHARIVEDTATITEPGIHQGKPITEAYVSVDFNGCKVNLRLTELSGVKGCFINHVSDRPDQAKH